MRKKRLTRTSALLLYLCAAEEVVAYVFEPMHEKMHRALQGRPFEYKSCLQGLIRRWLVRVEYKEGQRVYTLTSEGKLEALLTKAFLPGAHRV